MSEPITISEVGVTNMLDLLEDILYELERVRKILERTNG